MMGFLIRLLGSTGTGGIWIYLIIAGVIYGAGAVSATWIVKKLDGVTIADLQTDVANQKTETGRWKTALADQQKQTALDLARANIEALAAKNQQEATAAALTVKLVQAEKARQVISTQLLDTLKAIPHDQQNPLPASSRAYLRGVRDAQAAANTGAVATDH